jgi:hypothetical protein
MQWAKAAAQFAGANRLGLQRQVSGHCLFLGNAVRSLSAGLTPVSVPGSLYTALFDVTPSIVIWPNGPAELLIAESLLLGVPKLTVRGQRLVRTSAGLPGLLWRTVAHPIVGSYTANFWLELVALFGVPERLEWFRLELDEWLPGWPRALVSRYLVQIPNVGDELVYNGDFQIGGKPAAGWITTGAGSLTRSTTFPYGDGFSGEWVVTDYASPSQIQTAGAKAWTQIAGQKYTYRVSYKCLAGNVTNQQIYIAGVGSQVLQTSLPIADGEWHHQEIPYTATYGGSNTKLLVQNNAHVTCDVFFDNISVRKDVY